MKKSILLIPLIAAFAFTGQASAAIAGSPHDFSDNLDAAGVANTETAWNTSGEICKVCHVPHDIPAGAPTALWSRAASLATTFTMYSSTTLDGAIDATIGGTSKLCMSCHDGSVALDSFDGATGTGDTLGDTGYKAGALKVGTITGVDLDLSNEHPVSIVYDVVADSGLNPVTGTLGPNGSISDFLDADGKLQCATCHDVHGEGTVGTRNLLRETTTGSALCLECHAK